MKLGRNALTIVLLALLLTSCGSSPNTQAAHIETEDTESSVSPSYFEDPQLTSYENACSLVESGNYDEALAIFETLEGYKDSSRYIDGILCSDIIQQVSDTIESRHTHLSLVGMEVYCEYLPEQYTFREVWEIPSSGTFGTLSSALSSFSGQAATYDEAGLKSLAEDLYFNYFYPNGYLGVICEVEMRDYANSTNVLGKFSAYDEIGSSEENIQAYANTRDYVVQDGVLIEYLGDDSVLTIPEGIIEIGEEALSNKENLKTVYMPSTLKCIGPGAFYSCAKLEEVFFPDGLEEIGSRAFMGTRVTTIRIPKTVTRIIQYDGDYTPFEDRYLKEIYYDGTSEQWNELNVRFSEYQEVIVHCIDRDLLPFMQNKTWFEDEYTGTFVDEENGVIIEIIAYLDNNTNEISYYMSYTKANADMFYENMPVSLSSSLSDQEFQAWVSSPDYQGYIKLIYLEDRTFSYRPCIVSTQQRFVEIYDLEDVSYSLERAAAAG